MKTSEGWVTGTVLIPMRLTFPPKWGVAFDSGKFTYWEEWEGAPEELSKRTIAAMQFFGISNKIEGSRIILESEGEIQSIAAVLFELVARATALGLFDLPTQARIYSEILKGKDRFPIILPIISYPSEGITGASV